MNRKPIFLIAACAALAGASGCGSSKSSSAPGQSAGAPASALSADAKSAATGDVPDNQKYLQFHDAAAGYAMRYPEGWAQHGRGPDVTFQDKNNLVHVLISRGSAPTRASVAADVAKLRAANPSLTAGAPQRIALRSGPAIKVVYKTRSAPNPVTAKSVTLSVDRYVLARGAKVATVDLGTPVGVDNVDAYRMMIASFKWR